MTATLTTKQIKDGAGNVFVQRVLDASGTGEGPFLPLTGIADPEGEGPIDIAALTTAIVDAIGGDAAPVAADSGASSSNGYLRYLRDHLHAGLQIGAGSALIGKVVQQVASADVSATNPVPVGGAQLATVTATIASGASLSDAADLGTGRLVGLILPAAWTTAAITFQGSADGSTYFDLYDDATERAIASASVVPSRFIALPIADWLMVRSLKLRSGSAATPVAQGAARSITLVTAR